MNRGKKYIEAGWKRIENNPSDISLSHGEIEMMIRSAEEHGNIIAAILDAFHMGVEAGARMVERRCDYGKS